jgi:endonuclease/exonuclease/phosphatase family metal-dependent hydrolase
MKKPVKTPVKKAVKEAMNRAVSRAVDKALDTAAKKAEKNAAKKAARKAAKTAARRKPARKTRARARRNGAPREQHLSTPHLCRVRAPTTASPPRPFGRRIVVATYNVHRWTGLNGRGRPDPARAGFVISELQADVIALQEVLRPLRGDDPLEILSDALGLHMAFAATRVHKRGELGNAILSRWPIVGISMLDLSFSRLESRLAVAAQFQIADGVIDVISTHLALSDRTRHRQVRSLIEHPRFRDGPTVLLGDMNAWRDCKATRALDDALSSHHNLDWPASFPSTKPVLALDRIYARGVHIAELSSHASPAARRASDHLPVVARVELPD